MAKVNQPLMFIKRLSARVLLALVAGAGVALLAGVRPGGPFEARAGGQDLRKFNRFVQGSNTPAMKLLREGRDLLDGEEWAKAADKFRSFLASYPGDRDADVALYWLAYALKHEGKSREAAEHLTHLLREFPKSNWAEEATAMLTELAPQTGDRRLIDESLGRDNEELRIVALQSLFESNPERASETAGRARAPSARRRSGRRRPGASAAEGVPAA